MPRVIIGRLQRAELQHIDTRKPSLVPPSPRDSIILPYMHGPCGRLSCPCRYPALLALRGGQCVGAVHDAMLIHPQLRFNPEWADYAAPIATEILPAPSVVRARKG